MSTVEQLELPIPQKGKRLDLRAGVLELARFRDYEGVTVAEVRDFFNVHHGRASGALSAMHMHGDLQRLAERRDRCQVYVVPEAVWTRVTQPYGRTSRPVLASVDSLLDAKAEGRYEGRLESLTDVSRFTDRLREAVFAQNGNVAKRHDATCYTQHVECALLAVSRFIAMREKSLMGEEA